MKKTIIKVNGIWLEPTWSVAGTKGSFSSCRMCFEFSPEWEGMQKRATFFPADGTEAVEVLMRKDEVIIPDEVMAHAGNAEFVIDGIGRLGEKLITQKGEVRIVDTAEPGGKTVLLSTPDMLDQLRAEIVSLRAEIESLKGEGNGLLVF